MNDVPGAMLVSKTSFGAIVLLVVNDAWLKRAHPGLVSGKLSDLALAVLLPLFVAAVLEWALAAARYRPKATLAIPIASCAIAGAYFTLVKTWPAATHAHVAWLTAAFGGRFRAVSDPSDLVCLPAMALAWGTLARAAKERHLRARA